MLPPPPTPDTVDEAGNPVYFDGAGAPPAAAVSAPAHSGARPVYVPAGLALGPEAARRPVLGPPPGAPRPPGGLGPWGARARAGLKNPAIAGFLGVLAAFAAVAAVRAIAKRSRRSRPAA